MAKILAVDDSRLIRNIIRGVVETLGLDFMEAGSGRAALDLLATETNLDDIALILLDVNMPEMDGFTLLDTLKADERLRHIPVMMVTTESERERIVRAIRAGAVNYVCKPFAHEDLMARIIDSIGLAPGG